MAGFRKTLVKMKLINRLIFVSYAQILAIWHSLLTSIIISKKLNIFLLSLVVFIQKELAVPGYHTYWHSAEQKGYSGVG